MILTEEIINNLPLITEAELNEIDSPIEQTLDKFDKCCDIIDEMYDKYGNTLSQSEITQKINENFEQQGIKCLL